ncbi:replication-associated recombination protein A [Candidatus Neomarinimicrobiota bacterium]
MRPITLEGFIGQEELIGPGRLLRKAVDSGNLFSIIFWGPPGSGKTTLAKLLARQTDCIFHELSAVSAGVKEVRAILDAARAAREMGKQSILFIDEIHRFNKAQQDALLHAVEDGTILLIGATTENPSFEVISPLLSRCRVIRLRVYTLDELGIMLRRALQEDILLGAKSIELSDEVRNLMIEAAGGDARKLYNALEIAVGQHGNDDHFQLTKTDIEEALQRRDLLYDRAGDYHYDTISAFIKSIRGSDPDAAVYWLAVMIEGGEKPEFVARRLVILASEDIGNADPRALILATSCMQAVHMVGMPEGALILAQTVTYLASAPKSNASYLAIREATSHIKKEGVQTVPVHLRNAVTSMMRDFDYGKDYTYPHNEEDHFTQADYFPEGMASKTFYHPTVQGHEAFILERLKKQWPERYKISPK